MQQTGAERRSHFRVATDTQCSLSVFERGEWHAYPARLTDISLTGAQVECANPLTVGTNVRLALSRPKFDRLDARVVREVLVGRTVCFGLQLKSNWPPEVFFALAFPGEKIEAGEADTEKQALYEWSAPHGYEILRQIGSGGAGAVYEVRAPGGFLKALKRIPLNALGPMSLRELWGFRLVRSIRHPFLLSVDRLSVEKDHLVVIMELADGSLLDQYKSYRKRGKRGIPRRRLLPWLREAAEVLDLLNLGHGLQHLDIKPENLFLIGDHLKVGDYGLLRPTDGEVLDSNLNAMTPGYAAPELYDGRAAATSDQFSLAAVYVEMVTGRKPFSGTDARQIVFQILTRGPDLESLPEHEREVLARALHQNPAERFSSCIDFVDSLLHESVELIIDESDEPMEGMDYVSEESRVVRNETTVLQGHVRPPQLLTGSSGSLTGLAASAQGPSWALVAIYNNVGKLQLKQRKLIQALRSFRQALEVCEKLPAELQTEHQDEIAAVHCNIGQVLHRQGNLAGAVQEYEHAADLRMELAHRGEKEAAGKLATVYRKIGALHNELGNTEQAVAAYERACLLVESEVFAGQAAAAELKTLASQWAELATLQKQAGRFDLALEALQKARQVREKLLDRQAGDEAHALAVASADHAVGTLEQELGRLDQALAALQQSKDRLEELVNRAPDNREYARLFASVVNDLGVVYQRLGNLPEAHICYDRARELREKLVWEQPDVPLYTKDLAAAYNNIGAVAQQQGRLPEALQSCSKALELRKVLATENEEVPEYQRDYAAALHNMGYLSQATGRTDEAETYYEKAKVLRQTLCAKYPAIHDYARDLASTLCRIGGLAHARGRAAEAMSTYEQARDLLSQLADGKSALPRYRDALAFTFHQMAGLHADTGKHAEALQAYSQAIAIRRELVLQNPSSVSNVQNLTASLRAAAAIEQSRGNIEAAVKNCREAIDVLDRLLRDVPEEMTCRRERSLVHYRIAAAYRSAGDKEKSLQHYSLASDGQYQLVRENPESVDFRADLGATLHDRGILLYETGRTEQAIAALTQAIAQHRSLFDQDPQNIEFRRWLSDDYRRLTIIYHHIRRVREAVSTTMQRKGLWPEEPAELYRIARELSASAKLLQNEIGTTPEIQAHFRRVATLAIETLKEAIEQGWSDMQKLRSDTFFKPLHNFPDFQRLLQEEIYAPPK